MSDGIFPHRVTIAPILDRDDAGVPVFGETLTPAALVVPGRAVIKIAQGEEVVRLGVAYCEGLLDFHEGYITIGAPFSQFPDKLQILSTRAYPNESGAADNTEVSFG